MKGTSLTVVFVGNKTHQSKWVKEEVKMTLENRKPVYAIRSKDTDGKIPKVLEDYNIYLYQWSEAKLQDIATR